MMFKKFVTITVVTGFLCSAAHAAPGDVLRANFIAQMDGEFRAKDANGDGRLTADELAESQRSAEQESALAQNQALFAQLDANSDGMVSPQEFAALVAPVPLPDMAAVLQQLDANRDGYVTDVEYRGATLRQFDRLDTNFDGIVTEVEMGALRNQPTGR